MNAPQRLWWTQAKSDHDVFVQLRKHGVGSCHQLHYLQMASEKLAKAYHWRSGKSPPKSHAGFVLFLRFLGQPRGTKQQRHLARVFAFPRFSDLQTWLGKASPLAHDLERLAPDLANDGPNPEYPWPHASPTVAPAGYAFPLSQTLETHRGRNFLDFVRTAVHRFPDYADL